MDILEFIDRLDGARSQASGTSAKCPAHDDHVASLMVNPGKNGGIVVKCHAGCSTKDIVRAMGLSMADLMGNSRHVATYDYIDEQGLLRYSVHRYENPKTFRCVPGLPPEGERILYQSQAVAWARDNGVMIYIPEGEKDVDTLVSVGYVATCNVTGAGKWLPQYAKQLIGCHVTIIADNDEVGLRHARQIWESIKDSAASVRLTMVPEDKGKDVTDLFEAGFDLSHLMDIDPSSPLLGVKAIDVTEKPIEWAWDGYFALGKLGLIEGDPGSGKSLITIDLVSRWSTGRSMPWKGSGLPAPTTCVMVSAEDDPHDTLRPRLRAAGANLNEVILVSSGMRLDEPFSLISHLGELARLIRHYDAKVVTLDPLMAFFGDDTDTHNDASVRRALWPLKNLAEELHVCLICVRHHNKASGLKVIYRGGGSIGFSGAARSVFTVAEDPDNEAGMLFLPVKNNLAPLPATLKYAIKHTEAGLPYVEWLGESSIRAQEAIDGRTEEQRNFGDEGKRELREARRDQISFIYQCLRDGPLPWSEVIELGKAEGFSTTQLTRARPIGHLQVIYPGEAKRGAVWRLPTVAELNQAGKSNLAIFLPAGLYGPIDENLPNCQEQAPEPESSSPSTEIEVTDSMRLTALEMAPLICSVCGSDREVVKHAGPYWTVRCDDHDPEFFDGS